MKIDLFNIINDCLLMLSTDWKGKYAPFLEKERWGDFVGNMVNFLKDQCLESVPYFNEEIKPLIDKIEACFQSVLDHTETSDIAKDVLISKWAKAIEEMPFQYYLIILGLRQTSASILDEEALPPLKTTLLKSIKVPFNNQITIATRAWEKHIGRSDDGFWGDITGNPKDKEQQVTALIMSMLENMTWWNIFCHYKHGLVYEIRVPSGHGIRWDKEGTQLIGFLEPFLNEE